MSPKTERDENDPDVATLENVGVLFVPFDAAGKFYKDNVKHGVQGFRSFWSDTKPDDSTTDERMLSDKGVDGHFLERSEIATLLPEIVEQECELVRKLYRSDADAERTFKAFVESARPGLDPSSWSERRQAVVAKSIKGYKNYPDILFLSENSTGVPFPAEIAAGEHMKYARMFVLESANVPGIRPVNEMAVYLRADIAARIDHPSEGEDALRFVPQLVTRSTSGLAKGGKDEYILKITLGRRRGHSMTIAGVHLRATLTSVSGSGRDEELAALQTFCNKENIQLLIGDFNMDLQGVAGGRGIFFDQSAENEVVFRMHPTSNVAYPSVTQQYSNSSGNKHYMGYFRADTRNLDFDGQSTYGHMGASMSRRFHGGGKYYSDHPSLYVRLRSTRLTTEAQEAILRRKIVRVMRKT